MSEFWKRKMKTYMHVFDYDKDGYISENDFTDMGRKFADACNATPEKKDNLVRALIKLWMKFMKASDIEKGSRLTLPIFMESIKQQLYDPELITCIDHMIRCLFELLDISQDGYLQPDEHKALFANLGVPEETFVGQVVFDVLDVNGDGKLSFDEFIAGSLDFMFSQDESSPNKLYFGPLVD